MSETLRIVTGKSGGSIIFDKRELVPYNSPVLTIKTPEWNFNNPPMNTMKLANEMVDALKEFKGLGLACPQVGLSYRMFVMGLDQTVVAFFNPRILEVSKDTEILKEGCLSFPGLWLSIARPKLIHIDYYDYNGRHQEAKFSGITARIFHHEFDHVEGIPYTKKCKKLKLEMAIKKAAKENHFYKLKDFE